MPSFNSCVDIMINKLRQLADGKIEVPMKDILSSTALDVISKVSKIIITALIIPLLTLACVSRLEGYCNHIVSVYLSVGKISTLIILPADIKSYKNQNNNRILLKTFLF